MLLTIDFISGHARMMREFVILSGPGALSFFNSLKARCIISSVHIDSEECVDE